jgi:deoxyribodipyrimidine photo-lyase
MPDIHWFRNDLRLHDNPALWHTARLSATNGDGILPIFIFDKRIYGSEVRTRLSSSRKCGPRRAQFLLEAVSDLRKNLESCGSGLIIGVGKPEIILGKITKSVVVNNIVCQQEICSEELSINEAVRSELDSLGIEANLQSISGSTLYDASTLPFDSNNIPDTFSRFRKEVEECCKIGVPLDAVSDQFLKLPHDIHNILQEKIGCSLEYMPTLVDLGYSYEDIQSISTVDPRTAMPKGYKGGETFALARVQEYIWDLNLTQSYFDTRNGMLGSDYSTKFAPWLAIGNISPRYIARECRRYEENRVKNKSTVSMHIFFLI